jgi:hypothetical protein
VVDAVERWIWSKPDVEVCGFTTTWADADGQ